MQGLGCSGLLVRYDFCIQWLFVSSCRNLCGVDIDTAYDYLQKRFEMGLAISIKSMSHHYVSTEDGSGYFDEN